MRIKLLSIHQRTVFSATIILLFFLTLTAFAINKAFKDSTEGALKETLNSQLYALMANTDADIIDGSLILNLPSDDLGNLLGLPKSGLYARILDSSSQPIWQSDSALNITLPKAKFLTSGNQLYEKLTVATDDFYQFSLGVNWVINDKENPMTFVISQHLKIYNRQVYEFHNTLWIWLGGTGLFLILSQLFILRWGLSPLQKIVGELAKIEQGHQTQIESSYPKEIEFLSQNINHLLENENKQKTRYRNALGDLTHSLKTPLAVLQNSIHETDPLNEHILRMNSIVEYELQKASAAGANSLAKAINIQTLVQRVCDSLQKIYIDKNITLDINSRADLLFKADEGDMMELLGNIIDNAFKWSKHHIKITLEIKHRALLIAVQDDGPGFPEDLIEQLKVRGQRADQATPGHGIGLSIVSNIIRLYSGELSIINNPKTSGSTVFIEIN